MKTLGSFLAAIAIVLSFQHASLAQTGKDVVVTNTPTSPIPIRSVDDPARRAFQLGFEVNGPNLVTTPAGKIFVVEHVSGSFRLNTVAGSASPCRFLQLGLPFSGATGPPEALELVPTLMGVAPGGSNDFSFLSINHPMKFYIRPNSEIGGVNSLLGGSCTSSPIFSSRIVLSGYLVDSQ